MTESNQEVKLVVRFDEPAMRREAERASEAINRQGQTYGAGAAGPAATSAAAPSPPAAAWPFAARS